VGAALAVNDAAHQAECRPGNWATLRRTWQAGDRVTLRLPMETRMAPIDPQHPRRVALVYGPVVLMRRHGSRLALPKDAAYGWMHGDGPLEFRATERMGDFVPFYRLANHGNVRHLLRSGRVGRYKVNRS